MRRCPSCGAGELKIIAAILERPVIEQILSHLRLDPHPAPGPDARGGRGLGALSPTEPGSGGAGLQATAQAHRTHRRHIKTATRDPRPTQRWAPQVSPRRLAASGSV